jgi:tRNA threonylcarbamoyladenosine biosynthesis protein TsaB
MDWQSDCFTIAPVLILALDTSSPAGSVAVLRGDKVVGVVSTWVDEIYSSRMFRHLDFILSELALGLDQFDVFAVAAGPGSFTGLRVGLAAVKGWAEVYAKPIAAVSALEAVAVQARSNAPLLAPVLDARRGQVYYGLYRPSTDPGESSLKLAGEECVATPAEFCDALQSLAGISRCSVVTPSPGLISNLFSQSERSERLTQEIEITVEQVSAVLAPSIGHLAYLKAQMGELIDALALNANYVRRSDAERQWTESKTP